MDTLSLVTGKKRKKKKKENMYEKEKSLPTIAP